MRDDHISLNANQRQRLLVTCKHIELAQYIPRPAAGDGDQKDEKLGRTG